MSPDEYQEFSDNDYELAADEEDIEVNENELNNGNTT